jgi:putative peptide zinc metalloprotease protein
VAEAALMTLVLVLPDGRRVAIEGGMTIGRGDAATVKLEDPTVSRLHARIHVGPDGPLIADAGSRFGVMVAGEPLVEPRPLQPGTEIRLGNVVMSVERAEPSPAAHAAAPNATLVIPIGATRMGLRAAREESNGALRPRLRSGFALKRLEEDPGDVRYVLRDLRTKRFMQLEPADAELLALFDGGHTIPELLAEATRMVGDAGSARVVRLLSECGERGMLEGISPTPRPAAEPTFVRRALEPRERTFEWVGDYFARAYTRWGRAFFSPLAATGLILLSLSGLVTFSYLVGARYGTPLVVAHRLFLGGLVFIVGRFLIVAMHETAHGLALAHYGRTTDRAGLRLVLLFPFAFVDTSEAYFEPRRHRMIISAAGPASDFALGAAFSVACAASPRGNVRDVLFQLAFAAYVGAFFNANPFLERDGYQILTDWLREPLLRQRARAQMSARLSGAATGGAGSPVLGRYAIAGLLWSFVGAGFVIVLSLRYYDRLSALAPHSVVSAGFGAFFLVLLIPAVLALGMPLLRRARVGPSEVNRVLR